MASGGTEGGGAEGGLGESDSSRGVDAGPGQLRSSEEAGGPDSTGGDTEDGGGGHGGGLTGEGRGIEQLEGKQANGRMRLMEVDGRESADFAVDA